MKPFKLKYKNSSFPFKSPLKLDGSDPDTVKADIRSESDTLNVALADQVYSKSKVDSTLAEKGFDINTRKVSYGRGGEKKVEVKKLDERLTTPKIIPGQSRMIAPDDYNR